MKAARAISKRLLSRSPGARPLLLGAVAAGLLGVAATVVFAWTLAAAVDAIAFRSQAPSGTVVAVLAVAVAVRAVAAAAGELLGRAAAGRVQTELRAALADRALAGSGRTLTDARRGELVSAAVQGVDALAELFARALPQLVLAAVVPLALSVTIAVRSPVVGALLIITLPAAVLLMVLIGRRSVAHTQERQYALATLSAHFLEVVRGLPTLRAHGRAEAQARTLADIGERLRVESMGALRVALLSALVLELLAMLGVAVAAATAGVLLATGSLDLATGLFVLLLAPEVFAPLRAAGARYHAAEDGVEAARRLLVVLDAPPPLAPSGTAVPSCGHAPELALDGAGVSGGARPGDGLASLDLRVAAGSAVALIGPSGCGKSTVLELFAGVSEPTVGRVRAGSHDLAALDRESWWGELAWLAQRPALPRGTVADLLRMHAPAATGAEIALALERSAADSVLAGLPDGLDTVVGAGGRPLSLGEQQRLALAAVIASPAPLLLLDEPTAHLDAPTARRVAAGILAAAEGRTLLIATHDAALADACDQRVWIEAPPVWPPARSAKPEPAPAVAVHEPLASGPRARGARGGRWGTLALLALGSLAALTVLATSGWLVVRAAEQPPVLALLCAIVIVRAFGLIRAFARYYERLGTHDLALGAAARTRSAMFGALAGRIGLPGRTDAPAALTRFTVDVDRLWERDLRVLAPRLAAVTAAIGSVAVALLIAPGAGLALLAGQLAALLAVPALARSLIRATQDRAGAARESYAEALSETLALGDQLSVAGQAPRVRARLAARAGELGRAEERVARALAAGAAGAVAVAGVSVVAVLVAAGTAGLAPVLLGALVVLAVGAFDDARMLGEAEEHAAAVRAARTRLDALVGGPVATPAPDEPVALPPGPAPLSMSGVTHRPGGPGTPAVLNDVELVCEPGARIAIAGPSGTGKTTLALLLARLLDPDSGGVSYGGVDLRQADPAAVRERIRLVGQDAHLLAGTLAANLRIGRPGASDGELVAALERAGLGQWLAPLPHGLETLVGEDGTAVSGGQRQRIALARGLLSDAQVLILDEPTAMLDPVTAARVTRDVLSATADRTLIVITHDPTVLAGFEEVYELRGGRLAPLHSAVSPVTDGHLMASSHR